MPMGNMAGSAAVRFLQGTCDAIPVPNGCVDLVVSFETLEHILDQESFMREICRVLRPNGLLLISSPDRDAYSKARSIPNPYHVKELSHQEFIRLLSGRFQNVRGARQRMVAGSGIFKADGEGGLIRKHTWTVSVSETSPEWVFEKIFQMVFTASRSVPTLNCPRSLPGCLRTARSRRGFGISLKAWPG